MATVPTDEWQGDHRLPEMVRRPATVCHAAGEWARDEDGDGVRAVHNKTQEGLWTGLRDLLRPFRGVNQMDLSQDVALFAWGHDVKRATVEILRTPLGVKHPHQCPT
jgi:transposase